MASLSRASQLVQLFQQHLFVHFAFLHHILVFLTIFQTFSLLRFVLVNCDQWSLMLLFWDAIEVCPHKMVNLMCVCSTPSTGRFPSAPPLMLGFLPFPITWDMTILTLGQLITQQWPLSIQVKESQVFHFKSKARNNSEEGMLKADKPKTRPLVPTNQAANEKKKFFKEIKNATLINTWMIKKRKKGKTASLLIWRKF